jgi:hypothetical protein
VAHVNRRLPGRTEIGERLRRLLLSIALLSHMGAAPALAQEALTAAVAARRVQAAYLYRFAGYAQWPDSAMPQPDSPLLIGIWGDDALADDLVRLVAQRTVNGRQIEVHKLKDGESLAGHHILYIGRGRSVRIAEAISALPDRGTLIVTNSAAALRQGSAINFLLVDGQVRFEASPEAAEGRGITLSSRLLAVSQNLSGQVR